MKVLKENRLTRRARFVAWFVFVGMSLLGCSDTGVKTSHKRSADAISSDDAEAEQSTFGNANDAITKTANKNAGKGSEKEQLDNLAKKILEAENAGAIDRLQGFKEIKDSLDKNMVEPRDAKSVEVPKLMPILKRQSVLGASSVENIIALKGEDSLPGRTSSLGEVLPAKDMVFSMAYTIEQSEYFDNHPRRNGECSLEMHMRYWVIADDGKVYPTWHPPVDPKTGCKYGHEHGQDPSKSELYADLGPIPFGYAVERLNTQPGVEKR